MRIHNVRLGLATNSSSSHSLIFLDGQHDDDAGREGAIGTHGFSFGWEAFTLASKDAKRRYVAAQLYENLTHMTTPEIARAVVWAWVTRPPAHGEDLGIDHQSRYDLPMTWDGKGIDKRFFDEYQAFLLRDGLVILGGNDNGGEHHLENGTEFQIPPGTENGRHVARKDPVYGFWTLFNRDTGAKIRFSFDDPKLSYKGSRHERASAPELVDIKITDQCNFGCKFCYQNSTPSGAHADMHDIRHIAHALRDLQVFEVAIGGGEPTTHPDFAEILGSFRYCGIVPNFTTKTLAWMHDPVQRREIFENVGAFALSVDNGEQIEKLAAFMETYGLPISKASVQFVLGAHDEYVFESVVRAASKVPIRLTLLGYKRVGRGLTEAEKPWGDWLKPIKAAVQSDHLKIGIDTAIAARCIKELEAAKVPSWCYSTEEGTFSMYIDAVAKTAAPSSYEASATSIVKLTSLTTREMSSAFNTFGRALP